MTKFSLYYGVKRGSEELEMIALKGRGSLGELKLQLKEDLKNDEFCKKYSFLVIATDYGVQKRFKAPEPVEAPKSAKKKKGAD